MDKMRVYHISQKSLGGSIILKPGIPECAVKSLEDLEIKRICVAPTILGCLRALELPGSDYKTKYDDGETKQLFCYFADVDVGDLYQPTINQVPDACLTGELWILKPYEFKLLTVFEMIKSTDNSDLNKFYKFYLSDLFGKRCPYQENYSFSMIASNLTVDLCKV